MTAPVNPRGRSSGIPYLASMQPHRGELLCEFRSRADWFRMELRNHEVWGVEAQVFQNDLFLRSRRFYTRELAVQWAQDERAALLEQRSQ